MPVSEIFKTPLPNLDTPLVLVCHDAGAANIIFAWLSAMAREGAEPSSWRLCLAGPALRLWQQAPLFDAPIVAEPEMAMIGARTLLSGTGWASSLEHEARILAAEQGVRSIAAIDHWVNYAARFERGGKICLPDEIWVSDEFALAEVSRALPCVSARLLPNFYLAETVAAIEPLVAQRLLLYVLEPIRVDWGDPQRGEFAALDYFACHYARIAAGSLLAVRLRPHPSDCPGKYDAWIADHYELGAKIDDSPTLAAAISRASVVCGAETFAMVVALAAGRRVWSTLPPHAHRCRLPQPGIVHLRDLVSSSI
jgi:hypothetical protein